MPKISIIIPVFNTEKYLIQCLSSVINQTFKDFECICINDGSTDNSLTLLEAYKAKDNRISIVNQTNKGIGAVRNTGINAAKGKYLIFIDSDDWVENNYLELLLNTIESTKADIVQCNYKCYFDKNDIYQSKRIAEHDKINKDDSVSGILQKTYETVTWNRIYRKDLIADNNLHFYDTRGSEDGVFSAVMFFYVKKIVYIEDEIYIYRKQINSITEDAGSLFINWFYNFYLMIKEINYRNFLSEEVIEWCLKVFCWDFSRIGKNQSYEVQKEMLPVGVSILKYLLLNSKKTKNIYKLKILLILTHFFGVYSYKIVRILKNFIV